MAGYENDTPFSAGPPATATRYGAALMVTNDRILANSAQLLLVQQGVTDDRTSAHAPTTPATSATALLDARPPRRRPA